MSEAAKDNLVEALHACEQAIGWLERSLSQCVEPPYDEVPPEVWDVLEALASRFGRSVDLIVNKLFRAIDRYELEEAGSLLDASNRAVKRGLIEQIDVIRDFKDLRNEIVHEYAVEDVPALYAEIYEAAPSLLQLHARTLEYVKQTHGLS